MENQNKHNYGGIFGAIVPLQNAIGGYILSIFIGKPAWAISIGWVRRSIVNLGFLFFSITQLPVNYDNPKIAILGLSFFGIGILTSIISNIINSKNNDKPYLENQEHEIGGLFGVISKFQNLIGGVILQLFIGKPAWNNDITWLRRTLFNLIPISVCFVVNLLIENKELGGTIMLLGSIIFVLGVLTSIIKSLVDEGIYGK